MWRRFLFGVLLVLAWPHDARAQAVVRDDFSIAHLSPKNWFVCRRPENAMAVVARPGGGRAARLVAHAVKPKRLDLEEYLARERHGACIDRQGKYKPDGDQRAEIWERRELAQPFGAETWIQFEFMVASPPPGAIVPRLVIGQLKTDGDHSPVLAQRFTGRHFMVTLGQDNDSPGRHPEDRDCRVIVAHDASLLAQGGPLESSVGQDARDVAHEPENPPGVNEPDNLSGVHAPRRGCKRDIAVDARELLPSPFDNWVRMTYRIRPGIEDGLLEVWADGTLIAKAAGRIGYRDSVTGYQYFKFGPYADPAPYDLKAYLARYRRAPTCAQLGDPSATECRAK
jgi:hypothetical protein